MADKVMFGRLTDAFQGEGEKEETHADIPAELKAELPAIQEMERETLDGAGVFSRQRGGKGDLVFIINSDPMYKLVGGKKGGLAGSLLETCKVEFN